MKLHRFIGDYKLSAGEIEITDAQVIKQIKNVLGGKATTDTVTVIQATGRYC